MAIHLESRTPAIRTRPPTGYPRLDRGLTAFAVMYDGLKSPSVDGHVESVIRVALKSRIIEPDRFSTGREAPEINERLLYVIGCHLLMPGKALRTSGVPELFRRYKKIQDQLEIFNELRRLNLEGASLDRYAPILSARPEALLAMLADVGEYHDSKWRADFEGSRHKVLFDSGLTADEERAKIARIGRLLYGPLADFLGYRRLSGEISEIAAAVMFPDTFNEVSSELQAVQRLIDTTNILAYGMAKKIDEFCEREGITADISFRSEKNIGKIIEKVRYYRSNSGEGRPKFSVLDLSDLVAFKVVVKDKDPASKLSEEDKIQLVYRIRNFIRDELQEVVIKDLMPEGIAGIGNASLAKLRVKVQEQDFFRRRKANNYRSIHLDFKIPQQKRGQLVNFEIQLTTEEGDFWARRGGAAHFAYNARRYSGTRELFIFNEAWARMMDALKTGNEDVVAKFLVPSVALITVTVDAHYANGKPIVTRVIEIPSNRLVADALVRAGVDITKGSISVSNSGAHKLDSPLAGIGSVNAVVDPTVALSSRFATTILRGCNDVDTAIVLSRYLASTTR